MQNYSDLQTIVCVNPSSFLYASPVSELSASKALMVPTEAQEDRFSTSRGDSRGYQRIPNIIEKKGSLTCPRAEKVAAYFREKNNYKYVTTVIVSVRTNGEHEKTEFLRTLDHEGWEGVAQLDNAEDLVAIMDGQHRYMGVEYLLKNNSIDTSLPMQLFFDLNYDEEVDMFNTINKEQKVLKLALRRANVDRFSDESDLFLETITWLMESESSPLGPIPNKSPSGPSLYYRITTSTDNTHEFASYSTMERWIRRLFDGFKDDSRLRNIMEYVPEAPRVYSEIFWAEVRRNCSDAWHKKPVWAKPGVQRNRKNIGNKPLKYRLRNAAVIEALAEIYSMTVWEDAISSKAKGKKPGYLLRDRMQYLSAVDWVDVPTNPWIAPLAAGKSGRPRVVGLLKDWLTKGAEKPDGADDWDSEPDWTFTAPKKTSVLKKTRRG